MAKNEELKDILYYDVDGKQEKTLSEAILLAKSWRDVGVHRLSLVGVTIGALVISLYPRPVRLYTRWSPEALDHRADTKALLRDFVE